MKNKYYYINGKKTFCRVKFTEVAIFCDVFVPKKGHELHTKQGKWEDLCCVDNVRTSCDDHKWIVTVRMSYAAINPPSVWDWKTKWYEPILIEYLNTLINY